MLKKFVCVGIIFVSVVSWAGDRVETKHYSFKGSSRTNTCSESLEVDYPISGPPKVLNALQKSIGSLSELKRQYKKVDCVFESEMSITIEDKGDYVLENRIGFVDSGNRHFFRISSIYIKSTGEIIKNPFVVPKENLFGLVESHVDDFILEMCRSGSGYSEWNFSSYDISIMDDVNFGIYDGEFELYWNPGILCYCGEECEIAFSFTKDEIKPFISKQVYDLLD